jgi:lipoate-protein ligase A
MSGLSDQHWQFINSGHNSGSFNMDYDVALTGELQRDKILPTLRIYGWKPWAVSLGYNQSEDDINREKCKEYGFDIVRRPTGGRAILHANELTYSVVMPADGKGITEIYSLISLSLVAGLRKIYPDVSYETSQPNFQSLYKKQESIPCFSASARYEVQISGKKLVGSAQRRYSSPDQREIVLQHGSVLLGPEHKLLAEILNVENSVVAEKISHDIETKTIDLSSAAGRKVAFEETGSCIRAGFEQTMNVRFEQHSEEIV